MNKKLKVVLIALVAIILTLVSFVGIYVKKNGFYENIINGYSLGKNLKGSREITLTVDNSTKEVKYDENGNVVTDDTTNSTVEESEEEDSEEAKYTTVNEPVNSEDVLTKDNYKISKDIIIKRLNTLNITEYDVRLNEESGNILVELPENSTTDETVSYLNQIGSFEIVDSEDKTVLLDNKNIKIAQVAYNTTNTGTVVYLTIEFDKDGTKKLEEISSKYIATTDDEGNTVEKKVTIRMEDEDLFSTYFGETLKNGQMQLTVGSATSDSSRINEYLKSAASVSMLLNSGKMPIKYNINNEQFVKSIINSDNVNVLIYLTIAILVISFIVLVIKYKKYGALGIISSIISVDLLLLLIRYTNVNVSLESFVAFIVLVIINAIIIVNIVKNIKHEQNKEEISKTIQNGLLKSVDLIIISLIIAVVFSFMSISGVANIGLAMFWGIVTIVISHVVFLRTMLLSSND